MKLPKILKTNKRTILRRKWKTSIWLDTTKIYPDYNYIIYNYISPLYEKTNLKWIKEYIIWLFWLHPNVIKMYLDTYLPRPKKEAFTWKGPVQFIIFLCVTTCVATLLGGSVVFLFILTWIFFFSLVWGNIQDWYRFYTPSGRCKYDKLKNKNKKKSLLKASLKIKKRIILSQSKNVFNESVLNLAKDRWTLTKTTFQAYTFEPMNKYKNFLEVFDVNKYIIKYNRIYYKLDVVLDQASRTLTDQESFKDFLLLGNILNLIEIELKSKNYIVGDGTLEIKKVYANDYVYDHKNNMQVLLACYALCWLPVNQTISIPVLALGPWAVYEEKKKPWYVSLDLAVFDVAIQHGYKIHYFLDRLFITKYKKNPVMYYYIPQDWDWESFYMNQARILGELKYLIAKELLRTKLIDRSLPKRRFWPKPKKFKNVGKPLFRAWELGAFSITPLRRKKSDFKLLLLHYKKQIANTDSKVLKVYWRRAIAIIEYAKTQPKSRSAWILYWYRSRRKYGGKWFAKKIKIIIKKSPMVWSKVKLISISIKLTIFWCIFLFVSMIIYSLFKLILKLILCISKISLKSIKNFFNRILRTFNFIILKLKKLNKKEKSLKNNKNDKDLFNKTEFGLNWYRVHEEILNMARRVVREKLREEKQSDEHMLELRHDIVVGDIERRVKNDWHLIYDYESPRTVIAMKRPQLDQIHKNLWELSDILEYRLIAEQCVEANIYRDNLMDTLIYLCANMETSVSMVDETEYVNDMLNFFCIFPMTSQLETLSLNNVTQCNYFVDNKYQCLNKFKDNLISTRSIKQSEIKNDLIFCLSDQISMLEKVNNNSQLKKLNNKNQLKKVWKSDQNWHIKLKKITQMTWKELIIYL